jgi:hypothetical protein
MFLELSNLQCLTGPCALCSYANDRQKTQWNHAKDKATPQCKGEGPSLMISDMLTSKWGRLRDGEE